MAGPPFLLFYLYRVTISIAAEVMVRQVTSLGNRSSYQGKSVMLAALSVDDSTSLTKGLGTLFNMLSFGSPYMMNIWFQILAFVGMYKFMKALKPKIAILLRSDPIAILQCMIFRCIQGGDCRFCCWIALCYDYRFIS